MIKKAILNSDGINIDNVIIADPSFTEGVACPNEVSVDWTYENNKWWKPQPHTGWVKSSGGEDGSVGVWEAPVAKPETGVWNWNDDTESWVETILQDGA